MKRLNHISHDASIPPPESYPQAVAFKPQSGSFASVGGGFGAAPPQSVSFAAADFDSNVEADEVSVNSRERPQEKTKGNDAAGDPPRTDFPETWLWDLVDIP